MTAVAGSITDAEVDEFPRGYARQDGWIGAIGLYRSMLTDGEQIQQLANTKPRSTDELGWVSAS